MKKALMSFLCKLVFWIMLLAVGAFIGQFQTKDTIFKTLQKHDFIYVKGSGNVIVKDERMLDIVTMFNKYEYDGEYCVQKPGPVKSIYQTNDEREKEIIQLVKEAFNDKVK